MKKAKQALLVLRVVRGRRDRKVHKDRKVNEVKKENQALLVRPVHKDQKELKALKAQLDLQDPRETNSIQR